MTKFTKYISATNVKNYVSNDPILDLFTRDNPRPTHKFNILLEKGNEFESKIINLLQEKFKDDIVIVNKMGQYGLTQENHDTTVLHIKNKIPIIAQGVLLDMDNKIRGVPDLIVRNDYINKITNDDKIIDQKDCNGMDYRIVDIKWSSITLCVDGRHIINDAKVKCYKSQLLIYNTILGKAQNMVPTDAFILAKSIKKYNVSLSCLSTLGVIDYSSHDLSYVNTVDNAIKWVRSVNNKTETNVFPNASNVNDAPWTNAKQKLCEDIDEITQLWYVNHKHRDALHKKGVMSWKDPKCTTQNMGMKKSHRSMVIDKILDVNRDPIINIRPEIIVNNKLDWQTPKQTDFYVDFETINTCLYNDMNLNTDEISDIVFMIGIGYEKNNEWCYKIFTSDLPTLENEFIIFDKFVNFITSETNGAIPTIFHWGRAETIIYERVNTRHKNHWSNSNVLFNWLDMCNVFVKEPIVIKHALDFKLKSIGNAFYKLGYIDTHWLPDVTSGLDAMMTAINYYKKKNNDMCNVAKYNEIDCKVLWEIITYIRKNMLVRL